MLIRFSCVLVLLFWSGSEATDVMSGFSDTFRVGATVISRLLRPEGSEILSSLLKSLTNSKIEKRREGEGGETKELIPLLLTLTGVDPAQVKSFALDGFISLVHLMREVLNGEPGTSERSQRAAGTFSPFHFIMSQPQVVSLLRHMRDPILVDSILKESEEGLTPAGTECIRLLVCKTKPFVGGMQKSLKFFMKRVKGRGSEGDFETVETNAEDDSWEEVDLEDRMYYFVPSLGEVIRHGDECDERFPNCVY